MVHTDPIADFLTRIRNGFRARHGYVEVSTSKMKERIAEILKKEGYITAFRLLPQKGSATLRVDLRYKLNGEPMIQEIKRLSKPGCRRYSTAEELDEKKSALATTILTTSRGVMSDREARAQRIGGELLCRVM